MCKKIFEEGDVYYTIEKNAIVESIWDYQSEEMYSDDKEYFESFDDAFFSYKKNNFDSTPIFSLLSDNPLIRK